MRRLWAATVHVFQHAALVIVGFVLIVVGLAMTFSIVFMVPGLFVLAIGAALFIGGIWSHATRSRTKGVQKAEAVARSRRRLNDRQAAAVAAKAARINLPCRC